MEFPVSINNQYPVSAKRLVPDKFDIRDYLQPRRLTMAMWDQAFLLRHIPGGSYEDYDKVLDETIERGYNTVRIDPMPHLIDLNYPETVLVWPNFAMPYMPWYTTGGMSGPVGSWLIEFMEKLLHRNLHYTLSCWWYSLEAMGPKPRKVPRNHIEAAQLYAEMLMLWKKRFGFKGLVYIDVSNEVPYFLPEYMNLLKKQTDLNWGSGDALTAKQVEFIQSDLNTALALLRDQFPELRFTCSIHADARWIDMGVDFDCLDVHFWADADLRWLKRTRLHDLIKPNTFINEWPMFCDPSGYAEFSNRCRKTWQAIGPMLRARQRNVLATFSQWAKTKGMPLTTSESWSSWFYVDHLDLDWGWLLEWAENTVEDAIDFDMWGWTPHNYVQPHFENWKNVTWHQSLTHKFLNS